MKTLSFPIEIKSLGAREFEGYGSVFGNVDHGGDIVTRGAFHRSLQEHKAAGTMPLMLWMHQADQVPGVWHDMKEDDNGLRVFGELVDTQLGNDVHVLLQKKAVRGLSIGYRPRDVDFDAEGNRLLKQVELFETSIVSMAMNPLARIAAVKSRLSHLGEYVPTERELEEHFRNLGCSKVVARTLVGKMFDTAAGGMPAPRWDAGEVEDGPDSDVGHLLSAITSDSEDAAARSALALIGGR